MKNLIIFGTARSGKTTLASMISKQMGYNIISVDSIISAFSKTYPEHGFKHDGDHNYKITPFVMAYLDSISYNHEYSNFVIEGWHMRLEDIVKSINPKDTEVIVLGYPQLSGQEVLNNVRKYEGKFDYTRAMTDEQILKVVNRHAEISKDLQKECQKLGITFVDTSYDRPKVLDNLLKSLPEKLS